VGEMVTELMDHDFEEKLQSNSFVIDFYADWCAPCQALKPVFEKASKEFDKVNFFKVNVEKSARIASEFGVRSLPTIIFVKNGEEVERITGMTHEERLKEKLSSAFFK
jgi:thioredoxin 1